MKLTALAIALALTLMPINASADDHAQHGMKMDAAQGDSSKAYSDAMMKMHEKMSMKPTGNPDVDFAKGMIPHHEGAIDMAKVELQYGKDPELRKLAQEIVKAQETEIAFMKTWLAKNAK